MSSDPKAEDEPEVVAPPHAVEVDKAAAPADTIKPAQPEEELGGELGQAVASSPDVKPAPTPPSVTPGLDPGAAPSVLTAFDNAEEPSGPIPGSSPGMTDLEEDDAAPTAAPPVVNPPPTRRLRWGRALAIALIVLILWPPLSVLALKVIPPPVTILMLERLLQGKGLDKSWRSLDRIAPSLPLAVIAAEDAKFCEHDGFDWDAIRIAAEHNARSPSKVRGGSTISQQTAKNVFLWPSRDYVRKGLEAGYTVLIEKLWGKQRILEAYLNVVEWGPGLYGAQAAAQRYFHEDASALTPEQSARLAAILPSPLKWKAVNPGRYVARRSRKIGANALLVRTDDLAWCVRR